MTSRRTPAEGGRRPDDGSGPLRLRVLAVTNLWPEDYDYRGIFVEQLVRDLRRLGHHIDVEVVAQSRGRLDYLLAIPRVTRRARGGRYDIVHIHFGMAALSARFVGLPRVLSLYGSDINVRWKRWVTKAGWGGTAERIYVSRQLAATAGDGAAEVIPNGVDMSTFAPTDRLARRRELGFAPSDRVVLFGADPRRPVKGYDVFCDALAVLARRGVKVSELILSEPNQPTARVVAKLDAADLLLFTSQQGSEGSPTVIKEAVAMGLPVVSVDVGDASEVLAGVSPSAVVPFPSGLDRSRQREVLVEHLADRAAEILLLPQRSNGRERHSSLDSTAVAQRVLAVYQRAVER